MTRILRLEMKGFKSFANKTEILFGEKFNCVLGPNGSGKSNVLDAICFVLGKASAKGLRADKSANLIYNGGKLKNPAKTGEVSIVFSNENKIFGVYDELVITRIVEQTGQSKYKLNSKNSSRQEILDVLSKDRINPDGYNIILQGDINHLIEMSTVERRGIIEEIAGISIYEEKKEKALRELTRVDDKLNAAEIVLTERKTYLRELKKERDQALKFKELDEKIKRNKTTVLKLKKERKSKELSSMEQRVRKGQEEVVKLKEKEVTFQKEINEKKQQIDEINTEVERRGEKEQVKLHKEVEALKVDLAVKKQRVETLVQELQKVEQRKEELTKNNRELFDKIKAIETERDTTHKGIKARETDIARLETRLAEFRKKHNVEDASKIDEQIAALDKEAERLQEEIAKLREQQQNLLREKDRGEIKLSQIDEKMAKVAGIEFEAKKELEALKNKKEAFRNATKELNGMTTEDSSLAAQLQTARNKLVSRKEELAKLEGQQSSIIERIAGGTAITKILELKKTNTIKGIHGTVSSLGKVNEEFSLALEIAAGPRINSIVVDDDEVAARCIKHLRENKLGVATFLPLTKLRSPEEQPNIKEGGAIKGLAVRLVQYDPQYDKVFKYVFGATVVVDNIDSARKIGVGRARMVTLQGDMVETSGAMQGGFRQLDRRQGGFAQKETSEKIERLQAEIADMESVAARLEQKRQDNGEAIDRLRELKANLEGEIIKIEKSLHLDSEDMGLSKDEKKRLQAEEKELEKKLDDTINLVMDKTTKLGQLKVQKQQFRDQMTALRSPTVLAEMNTFEEKKNELKNEISELHGQLRSSESEVKNVLGPETEKIQNILKQQEKEKKSFADEKSNLETKLKELETSLKEKEAVEKEFFSQFKGLFTKRNKLSDEIAKHESSIKELQMQMREFEGKGIGIALEIARLKAELAGVVEELKQFEGIEPYPEHEKSEEDILVEIREFERLRESIGAVNMKALQIYEQVEREFHELTDKRKKLAEEREDVLIMINEIDAKKKDLLMRTFDVVNTNFQHFFSQLSKKGQEAYLEMEDPNDPFQAGMTIKVKLTGTKWLDIRSLSGGEKTLTALSFLFAVQEHEPASFYIMDEVDAALDKHNSELLSRMIRKYCDRAQYVIISHNDGVIGEADNLYGVSMNEHGISKITSLKI